MEPQLVAGRSCGSCNVCCVALTIDDYGLQKPQGIRCPNATKDNRCGIYETRPYTCRQFFCGWRLLKWVKEPLRPDNSGVLIRLKQGDTSGQAGIIVTLLNGAALRAEGLAETVAAAVAAEVPVYLHIPGPPGHTAAQAPINDVLREAVLTRNKAAVLDILARLRKMGRAGEHQKIVMRPRRAVAGP